LILRRRHTQRTTQTGSSQDDILSQRHATQHRFRSAQSGWSRKRQRLGASVSDDDILHDDKEHSPAASRHQAIALASRHGPPVTARRRPARTDSKAKHLPDAGSGADWWR